ncbi:MULTISPECIES: hypothetical protein [Mesorhizobium]|uniref:Uncharacterized protein n=1 Tax=Rhizobium loti TaxID=381 RepID=A0A6M7U235_RHILI|nr:MULTISPECIES: hypothetical protein [Mesorhizobium]KRB22520.1 hypothetical protein ASE05_15040 [Mesorhizobium sp. Root172]OBQ62147.1 hypothetical protein A8145_21015 [Mesorhizobium loti]QKC71215.1 hypothetical protein EB815_20280 [Mesorhizobium loti]QKC90197.1 hypothetical protein EB230_18645 [Mesorhizobium sp. NZP2234]
MSLRDRRRSGLILAGVLLKPILNRAWRERLTLVIVVYAMSALVAWALSVAAASMVPARASFVARIFGECLIDGLIWPVRLARL